MYTTDFAANANVTASSSVSDHSPKNVIDPDVDTYWQAAADDKEMTLTLALSAQFKANMFNVIMLQEYLPEGQRIATHEVAMSTDGKTWKTLASGSTVGHKRLYRLKQDSPLPAQIRVQATSTAFNVTSPALSRVGLFLADSI